LALGFHSRVEALIHQSFDELFCGVFHRRLAYVSYFYRTQADIQFLPLFFASRLTSFISFPLFSFFICCVLDSLRSRISNYGLRIIMFPRLHWKEIPMEVCAANTLTIQKKRNHALEPATLNCAIKKISSSLEDLVG
jgi:hypothetical protein